MCPLGGIRSADAADGTVKMMLFRGDVLPGIGGHAPWVARHGPWRLEGVRYAAGRPAGGFAEVVDPKWRFDQPAAVHHYKWTAGLAEDVRRRREAPGASAEGTAYGARCRRLPRTSGRPDRARGRPVAHPGRPAGGGLPAPRAGARGVLAAESGAAADDWQGRLRALRHASSTPAWHAPPPAADGEAPRVAKGWRVRRLTDGTTKGRSTPTATTTSRCSTTAAPSSRLTGRGSRTGG